MTDFEELVTDNLGSPASFIFSDKGKEIFKLLQKKRIRCQKEDTYKWLPVLWACWLAHSGQFEEHTVRKQYDEIIKDKEMESPIKAFNKHQKFHKKHPNITYSAVMSIFESSPLKNEHKLILSIFDQILNQYPTELQAKLDEISQSDPLEEPEFWPYGGLFFPSDLPFGRSIIRKGEIKKQSLLFHLVFVFRHITSDNFEALESPGGPMPKYGKPCYSLVAKISNMVLEKDIGEDSVKKIVGRLENKTVMYFDPSCPPY